MKDFVLSSSLFLAIIFVINCFLYAFIYENYLESYKKVDYNFKSYLLSDSHGSPLRRFTEEFGIYNFSAGGDSYHDMYRKAKHLINTTDIDTIIITVDDHTLSHYRHRYNNLDRSFYFASPSDYDSWYEMITEKYIRHYLVIFNPKNRDVIRSYIRSNLRDIRNETKQSKQSATWSKLTEKEVERHVEMRASTQFPSEDSSSALADVLIRLIELCRENSVELIGIKYPLAPAYADFIGSKSYKADSVFRAYGLKVYDFKELYRDRNDFFEDADHLNSIGGKSFAKQLHEEITKVHQRFSPTQL